MNKNVNKLQNIKKKNYNDRYNSSKSECFGYR